MQQAAWKIPVFEVKVGTDKKKWLKPLKIINVSLMPP